MAGLNLINMLKYLLMSDFLMLNLLISIRKFPSNLDICAHNLVYMMVYKAHYFLNFVNLIFILFYFV